MKKIVFKSSLCYTTIMFWGERRTKIMINEKQEILATVNTLPEDTTWDDATYTLYLHSKLQKSQEDIKNGRVMTVKESKERMKEKYASFDVK